jgi:hypothetical protein
MKPGEPKGYHPDTVLKREQLAKALDVSEDTIERCGLLDIASYALGSRCPRWIWKDVIEWLHAEGRAA